MAYPSPQCDTTAKSDAMHYIDDASAVAANVDLTAISGKPFCPPQKTTLWSSTGTLAAVLVDEDGATFTINVGISPVVISRPVKQLTKSGSGAVRLIFEWFDPNSSVPKNR